MREPEMAADIRAEQSAAAGTLLNPATDAASSQVVHPRLRMGDGGSGGTKG